MQKQELSKKIQKGPKNGTPQMDTIWTWGPPGSQIDPRLIPESQNRSIRPFCTPKWLQNDIKMEPFEWEIITRCHVISAYGGTAKAGHKWSGTKKWREFRPCRSHFFEAKRPHSTQRVREEYRKIGESSVYANGCFLVCTGCTVRSRCESCQKKMASIPSIQMTVLHNASATQYTASEKAAWKRITRAPSM